MCFMILAGYSAGLFVWSQLFKGLGNAIQWITIHEANYAINWIVIFLVDSVIHPLNNWGQYFSRGRL